MQIDKDEVLKLIREHGKADQADNAAQELPDKVDTDQHGGLLAKYGVDPKDLLGKLGGLGGIAGH